MLPQAVFYDELGMQLDRIIQELCSRIDLSRISEFEEVWEAADRVLSRSDTGAPGKARVRLSLSA